MRNRNLEGRTTINFKIDDQGHAKDINIVETRTNIKYPSFRDCLIHNVQSLKFPSADINDFTNVTFPFKLQRN